MEESDHEVHPSGHADHIYNYFHVWFLHHEW